MVDESEAIDHCHGHTVRLSLALFEKNWRVELYKVNCLISLGVGGYNELGLILL